MNDATGEDIGAVLALTEAVQQAIDAGDWRTAARIESERLAALQCLVATRGGLELERLKEFLANAAERNHRLIGEVDHHRRRLLREAEMTAAGHRAVDRYITTARSR